MRTFRNSINTECHTFSLQLLAPWKAGPIAENARLVTDSGDLAH